MGALIEWAPGRRDSVDGRWFINTGSTRDGDRSVREFYLIDQRDGRPGVPRGVFNRAVEARERAEEIVAEERFNA